MFSISGIGQGIFDSIPEIELATIAEVNQGSSYITLPSLIGNIEPIWFEGNLTPNFHIRKRKDSRLLGVITPKIVVRMYREESFPVRTPSYMPQITGYYLLSSKTEVNSLSVFGKIAHHSNGQESEFYLPNGEINYKSGNFVTNYFKFGMTKTNYNTEFDAAQFFSTSLEVHPYYLMNEEIRDIYSLVRWNSIFSIFKLPTENTKNKKRNADFSIKGQSSWMFGNYNDLNSFSLNRLNLSLIFYYHSSFFEDVGLYTQIYRGMDYYNIYFDHQITVITFGIMTEKLRF